MISEQIALFYIDSETGIVNKDGRKDFYNDLGGFSNITSDLYKQLIISGPILAMKAQKDKHNNPNDHTDVSKFKASAAYKQMCKTEVQRYVEEKTDVVGEEEYEGVDDQIRKRAVTRTTLAPSEYAINVIDKEFGFI